MAVGRMNRSRKQAFEIDRLTGPRYNFDNQMTSWTALGPAGPASPPCWLASVLLDRLSDLCLDTADRPAKSLGSQIYNIFLEMVHRLSGFTQLQVLLPKDI